MPRTTLRIAIALLLLFAGHSATAQEIVQEATSKIAPPAISPIVTVSATAERVRFTAPNTVVQMHLQVYADSGQLLFDVTSKGNALDWTLQDGGGDLLATGSYLCVVTVKSLSGKLSQRVGSALVQEKKIEMRPLVAAQFTKAQDQAVGPIEANGALTIVNAGEVEATTVLAHDGKEGQVIRGRGALSFRLGDFFSGTDREQMRLTEEGNLGVGTAKPRARLDVAGLIRAREGFQFSDGSTLKINEKGVLTRTTADGATPSAVSSTQNRIVKFTDNAGTLGDSVVTEAGGNIGVGNPNPASLVHIGPFAGYGVTTGLLLGNNLLGTQYDRALQVAPVQTGSPSTNSILLYTLPTINAGITVPTQYGFFIDGKQGPGAIGSYAALATGQGGSLGATNNTHLLMGQAAIPSGNYGIYDATTFRNFFSGNVGIGTNTPLNKLHVLDTSNTGLRVQTNITGGTVASFGGNGDFQIDAPGVMGGRFVVKEGGRVGLGTNAPLAALDLKAGADSDGSFDPAAMAFQYRTGGFRHWIRTRHNSVIGSGNAIDFFVNGSTTSTGSTGPGLGSGSTHVMTLDSGRVGIGGILSPTETLSVGGKIESTFGGFKFPDGSVQTTAANATYTTHRTNQVYIANAPAVSVIELTVPAGTYLLSATLEFGNNANFDFSNNTRDVHCKLPDGLNYEFSIAGFGLLTMTFHSVVTVPAGIVDLKCAYIYPDQNSVYTLNRRLTAVKIETSVVVQ